MDWSKYFGWKEPRKRLATVLALILAGSVFALSLPRGEGEKAAPEPPAAMEGGLLQSDIIAYERALAADLEAILSSTRGVGRVQVALTLESAEEKIYAANETRTERETVEVDPSGGRRNISEVTADSSLVTVRGGTGDALATTVVRRPKVRGVLIVAEGASDPAVKEAIVEAARALLDVSANRIMVLPGKEGVQ